MLHIFFNFFYSIWLLMFDTLQFPKYQVNKISDCYITYQFYMQLIRAIEFSISTIDSHVSRWRNWLSLLSGNHEVMSSNPTASNRIFCNFFYHCPFLLPPFSLPSQRNIPISFKPKVAIAKFVWKMQKKVWYYEKWVGRQASFSQLASVKSIYKASNNMM